MVAEDFACDGFVPLSNLVFWLIFSLLLLAPRIRIHSTSNLMEFTWTRIILMMVRYLKNGNTVFHFTINLWFWIFWKVSPEYKQAFKHLKPRQRLTIQINFIAFFFSWIYLFVCVGLWKKAIIVIFIRDRLQYLLEH